MGSEMCIRDRSAPDAVPRVPGGGPGECGLALQSVHAAAELVCRGRVVVLGSMRCHEYYLLLWDVLYYSV